MKTYKQIPEDAEYREMYDSYRRTVDNLNSTDFLYETMMSNGQVFFKDDEVYGFVNGQPALRNRNLIITRDYIDNFRITNFILFTRMTNDLITLDINCNLANYRDNKVHYLYVVLDHHGTYEVWDDMFQSDENKILFARFLIGTDGNSRQFYMMLPFAGSADYIKGNQFFQVTDGLRLQVINGNTKQFTVSKAKIRFSAINFDDKSSPDCITIDHSGSMVPIRYVYWDATSNLPRVDWESSPVSTLDFNTVMSYTTGRTSRVAENSYSIQKLYYDVYERCIVAMYGNTSYATRDEAIYAIDTVMSYPLPDGIEYLIPIACVVMKNTTDPIDDTNFRIVNLDYNEQEVLDSDTFTRQQAAEAVEKSRQALANTQIISQNLSDHVGNVNNPHRVRLNQLLKSDGTAGTIDDSFAESGLTVNALINRTLDRVGQTYYAKTGGTISGSVSVTQTLSVSGKTTLAAVDTAALKVSGNITFDNNSRTLANSTYPVGTAYIKKLYLTDTATVQGLETYTITPRSTATYSLGSDSLRWHTAYINTIKSNHSIQGTAGTFSSTLSVTGKITASGGIDCDSTLQMGNEVRINVSNGYIVIGGYSLRLGESGSIPTPTGYGIW